MAKLIYQIYPISLFAPAYKGDFRSPLQKIIDFLPRLAELNVDYLWLSPIYPTMFKDHGYDITHHTAINTIFGNMNDFRRLVKTARRDFGIKILMDLVLNHTSVKHAWFKKHPEYYCWSNEPKSEWRNLFNGGSCWEYDQDKKMFYLHLFHKDQADLNWFPDGPSGNPNPELIKEFQDIVDFWTHLGVAGFRLDVPQSINKDIARDRYGFTDSSESELLHMAKDVINGIFCEGREDLYLLMECFDLTGKMCNYYYINTPINGVMDITVKKSVLQGGIGMFIEKTLNAANNCPNGYVHVTESHDAPRFTSAANIDGKTAIDILFGSYNGKRFLIPQTIVMYQGQELGLKNPSKEVLTDEKMLGLDAETAMRYQRGETLDALRPTSRANARVAIPMDEYRKQEKSRKSNLGYTIQQVKKWRFYEIW